MASHCGIFRTNLNRYKCPQCPKVMKSAAWLSFHQKKRHENPRCQKRSKTFPTKHSLKKHEAIYSSQKNFACKICGAKFKTKSSLCNHMKRQWKTKHLRRKTKREMPLLSCYELMHHLNVRDKDKKQNKEGMEKR